MKKLTRDRVLLTGVCMEALEWLRRLMRYCIESSQALVRKKQTGKPSQNQAIESFGLFELLGKGPGYESQPAHHFVR